MVRTIPSARGEKKGFTTKTRASATFHHLYYALVNIALTGVFFSRTASKTDLE